MIPTGILVAILKCDFHGPYDMIHMASGKRVFMVGRKDSGCAYTHESVQRDDIASDSYNPITKVK